MHFIFPGRMATADLADEARRVAAFLRRHELDHVYGVRLRLKPIRDDAEAVLVDRFGDPLELLEVPPYVQPGPPGILDAERRLPVRRLDLFPRGDAASAMRRMTGPDRGPASFARDAKPTPD